MSDAGFTQCDCAFNYVVNGTDQIDVLMTQCALVLERRFAQRGQVSAHLCLAESLQRGLPRFPDVNYVLGRDLNVIGVSALRGGEFPELTDVDPQMIDMDSGRQPAVGPLGSAAQIGCVVATDINRQVILLGLGV